MLGFGINEAKGLFFDRKAVQDKVDPAARKVLGKFGAFVRQRARTSIRKRKAVSEPGQPPSSHLGLVRQWILFAFDKVRKSVVIGAARLRGKIGNAPEALERGGPSQTLVRLQHRGLRGFLQGMLRQTRTTNVRARPYMQPAFDAEIGKLPGMFQDTVK